MTDTLVRQARGLQEEKKARKKDKEDIVTQIKEDKEDIVTQIKEDKEDVVKQIKEDKDEIIIQIRELLSAKVGEIKEEFKTDVARIELKLDAQKTERHSTEKELREQIKELYQKQDEKADKQNSLINDTRDSIERVSNMIAVIVEQNSQLELKIVDSIAEMTRIGEKCTNRIMTTEPVIRLVGGTGPHEGRVELLYEGSYGTVCDDDWGNIDATIACKMLGYQSGTAFNADESAYLYFGAGTGQILLDDVRCSGGETSLFDCQHLGIGKHDCNHNEDAGVRCIVN